MAAKAGVVIDDDGGYCGLWTVVCGCVTEEQDSHVEMIFTQGTEPARASERESRPLSL